MNLTDKITSIEDFEKVRLVRDWRYDTGNSEFKSFWSSPQNLLAPPHAGPKFVANGYVNITRSVSRENWWWLREALRFHNDRDAYGSVLQAIWEDGYLSAWCPKPHQADLTKIEFYPDAVAAAAERPIVTTMAKFLRRVSPLFTDEYIRDVDASYRASMSNELEILTGVENFRLAYQSGPSSCMAVKWQTVNDFPLYNGAHPVDAYALGSEGFGIAVGRDGSGRINARCVIYTSPTDEKDKRAVRVYGDSSLGSRLKRNGYKFCSLKGLHLKALPYGERAEGATRGSFVAPYMDGPEGHHDSPTAARKLIRVAGEDILRIVDNNQARDIGHKSAGLGVVSTAGESTSQGILTITDTPVAAIQYECPLTGEKFDLLNSKLGDTFLAWHEGEIVSLRERDEFFERFPFITNTWHVKTSRWVNIRTAAGVPLFEHQPRPFSSSTQYLDTPETRATLGYAKLHPTYYPDNQEWVLAANVGGKTSLYRKFDGHLILAADGMEVIKMHENADLPVSEYVHKTTFSLDEYVRVHSVIRGQAAYAHKSVPVVKTITGRTVVPRFHEVVQLWDGGWAFQRGLNSFNVAGGTFYAAPTEPGTSFVFPLIPADSHVISQVSELVLDNTFSSSRLRDSHNDDRLFYQFLEYASIRVTEGFVRISSYPYERTTAEYLTCIRDILNDPDASLNVKNTAIFTVRAFRHYRNAYVAKHERDYAERRINYTMFTDTSLPGDPDTLPRAPVLAPATPDDALLAALQGAGDTFVQSGYLMGQWTGGVTTTATTSGTVITL